MSDYDRKTYDQETYALDVESSFTLGSKVRYYTVVARIMTSDGPAYFVSEHYQSGSVYAMTMYESDIVTIPRFAILDIE